MTPIESPLLLVIVQRDNMKLIKFVWNVQKELFVKKEQLLETWKWKMDIGGWMENLIPFFNVQLLKLVWDLLLILMEIIFVERVMKVLIAQFVLTTISRNTMDYVRVAPQTLLENHTSSLLSFLLLDVALSIL